MIELMFIKIRTDHAAQLKPLIVDWQANKFNHIKS